MTTASEDPNLVITGRCNRKSTARQSRSELIATTGTAASWETKHRRLINYLIMLVENRANIQFTSKKMKSIPDMHYLSASAECSEKIPSRSGIVPKMEKPKIINGRAARARGALSTLKGVPHSISGHPSDNEGRRPIDEHFASLFCT
ncbi:hypothetical protein CDAR_557831 [Caerostris darwini]|uniref:Uncharacterized protein n=1 Tax=Caerostris darwini TaxID=1538125 RepID=A0AAV4RE66_9ARAC|nr:hypothetical protein CDAR_557831 [Caerostris darwini]